MNSNIDLMYGAHIVQRTFSNHCRYHICRDRVDISHSRLHGSVNKTHTHIGSLLAFGNCLYVVSILSCFHFVFSMEKCVTRIGMRATNGWCGGGAAVAVAIVPIRMRSTMHLSIHLSIHECMNIGKAYKQLYTFHLNLLTACLFAGSRVSSSKWNSR